MQYEYKHFRLYYNTLEDLDKELNILGEDSWNLKIRSTNLRNGVAAGQPINEAVVFGKRKIEADWEED